MVNLAWLFALSAICVMARTEREKARLEVVLYESTEHGDYKTYTYSLSGQFSAAGPAISAEGEIVQIHPLGLCNHNDEDHLYEYGWVGVVKLEEPHLQPDPCMSVYQKAERAIQRGATAVVFDVTDDPEAGQQLNEVNLRSLERPVVIITDHEASRLMQIVNTQKVARARIVYTAPEKKEPVSNQGETKEYFEMGIFVAIFLIFCVICIIVILKLKWRHRNRQISIPELAKRAVAKLETRKYKLTIIETKKSPSLALPPDYFSQSSLYEACAICLEEYRDGQELRVLPCSHEFHRSCVDPWLITNCTCPLCLYNIIAHPDPPPVRPVTGAHVIVSGVRSGSVPQSSSSDGSVSQLSHIAESEYHRLHLMHTCPSCEGTIASSHSPTSSNGYIRDYVPFPVRHKSGRAGKSKLPPPPHYENISPHRLQQASCMAKSSTDSSLSTVFLNSGISNCFHNSANSWQYSKSKPHPVKLGHAPVHPQRAAKCGPSWESDPEYVFGCSRDKQLVFASGAGTRKGSSSDSSLECECCGRLNSDVTLNISNQSTCGSVDRVLTDVSSYDSNVYRCHTPDLIHISQDRGRQTIQPKVPVVRLKPVCVQTSPVVHETSRRTENSRLAQSRLSFTSSVSDTVNSSPAPVNLLPSGCRVGLCELCNSPGTSQVSLGGVSNVSAVLSDIGLISDTGTGSQSFLCRQSRDSTGSLDSTHSESSVSPPKVKSHHQTVSENSKSNVINNLVSSSFTHPVPDSATPTCAKSSSIQLGAHRIPCQMCVNQSAPSHMYYQTVRDQSGNSQSRGDNVSLDKGHNSGFVYTGNSPPRQSMVLFTEDQGSVTLPLEDEEKYDPINGV